MTETLERRPLARIEDTLADNDVFGVDSAVWDIGIPYGGELGHGSDYMILGSPKHGNPDQNPRLRARLEYLIKDNHIIEAVIDNFYALAKSKDGSTPVELFDAGMPRLNKGGSLHELDGAPKRIAKLGSYVNLLTERMQVIALTPEGVEFRREYNAHEFGLTGEEASIEAD